MKNSLLLTLIFTILVVSCSTASNKIVTPSIPFNVQKYGENAPKIWTPLNHREMEAVIKAKESFDDEVQILLAILLTGDLKEPAAIEASLNVYKKFIQLCENELSGVADAKEKGKKLHELFFKQFIGTPRKKGSLSSGLPGILLTKEYDAETANLLFAIIAERFGFSAEISATEGDNTEITSRRTGLALNLLSGKTFLSIKHKDLYTPIVVFPFIEKGFDLYINLGSFQDLNEKYPELFDSPATELQKYYRKKILSFKEALLFLYKIGNVDLTFNTEDALIHKRIEVAAQLTENCEILLDRIWVWRNIYSFLMEKENPGNLVAFVDMISKELEKTAGICGEDPGFVQAAWDLYLFSSFEFGNIINGEKVKKSVEQAYRYLSPVAVDYDKKKHFLTRAIYHYTERVVQKGLVMRELSHVQKIIDIIPENEKRAEVASDFYFKAGDYYFDRKDLWTAGQFYVDCAFQQHSTYLRNCTTKGVSTLYSYAENSIKKGVCPRAADARDKCLDKMPDKNLCRRITDLYEKECVRINPY